MTTIDDDDDDDDDDEDDDDEDDDDEDEDDDDEVEGRGGRGVRRAATAPSRGGPAGRPARPTGARPGGLTP